MAGLVQVALRPASVLGAVIRLTPVGPEELARLFTAPLPVVVVLGDQRPASACGRPGSRAIGLW